MNPHTPGPWRQTYNKKFGQHTIRHTGFCEWGGTNGLAQVLTSLEPELDEANARLMAAAPELYDMLVELTTEAQSWVERNGGSISWLDDAKNILAKVEGEY